MYKIVNYMDKLLKMSTLSLKGLNSKVNTIYPACIPIIM